jgi:hypothetical protein
LSKKKKKKTHISLLVLKDKTRLFHSVISKARLTLRTVFGFTLVELPALKNISQAPIATTQTQTQVSQRGGVTGSGGGGGGSSTGSYILQNILKEDYNKPDIIIRSNDENIKTGILYAILGIIFANEQQMISSKWGHPSFITIN